MTEVLRALQDDSFLPRLLGRDASLWSADPAAQELIRNRLGWLTIHEYMAERLDDLRRFSQEVQEGGFRDVVLLGMGGSSLAPEVFQRTIGPAHGFPPLTLLDTTDPASIRAVEISLDVQRTLFFVSSKSGTTIETLSLYRYFADRCRAGRDGDAVLDNFVAITDPGTPLAAQARAAGFRRCFLNPPDVGGRYSALSYFGLAPAAAIGVDAARVLEAAAALPPRDALQLGATLAQMAAVGRDKITFLAPPALQSFSAWTEQLLAESTGKDGKGLIPIDGEPAGAPSAYAGDRLFVRLALEGQRDGLDQPLRALQAAGYPVITLTLRDAHDLGREFLRWEIATAAAGAALGINPFDEPNVKESKDNTNEVLREAARAGRLPEPEPAAADGGLTLYYGEPVRRLLDGRAALPAFFGGDLARPGDYFALLAYVPRTPEHDALLTQLRTVLRDATGIATTHGYGPRYLHSTGQLHKGGPDKGVFLQITADDPQDLEIPGESAYGFSTLKRAQALGDMQALQSRGRRLIRVHLGADATGGLRTLVDMAQAAAGAAVRAGGG
ncbi:MAG: glucose-6-phosphate isomerase [Dehalococcoidia bacterium]|nr:glucose-6-phosphate isomerase [Dehalococcoidia bacterium]